jgi:hypothetical protein
MLQTVHMKWRILLSSAPILLIGSMAFASDLRSSCELAKESILSMPRSGPAQVSNVGDIHITCRIPARSFPAKPGEHRNGLTVTTTTYEISPNGSKKLVPSEVHVFGGGGGGFGPNPEPEWVEFYVHIPLDSKELDREVSRYVAKLVASMTPEQKAQFTEDGQKKALANLRELVYQHRVGHFRVDCQVLDGSRVMGSDGLEIEVLFKGRFSDIGLPGSPPV